MVAAMVPGARSVTGRLLGASNLAASAAGTTSATTEVPTALSCSGLDFISARGSGETWDSPTTRNGSPYLPGSPETNTVLQGILQAFKAAGVTVPPIDVDQLGGPKTIPNLYQAPSVDVLKSGLSWNPLKWNADLNRIFLVNMPEYLGAEQNGEAELYALLTATYQKCQPTGQEPAVVLAGYSQGAMLVHNVLNLLAAEGQTGPAALVKGAVLIADPERVPFSDVVNLGTAPASDYGICRRAEVLDASCILGKGPTPDVANDFAPTTVAVCDNGDIICDTSADFVTPDVAAVNVTADIVTTVKTDIKDIKHGIWVHTNCHSYCSSEVITAGRWIGRKLIDGLGAAPAPTSSPTPTPTPTPSPSATSTGTWTAVEAALPSGAEGLTLNGMDHVACVSASFCVAVGDYKVSELQYEGVIDTFNGSSWSTMTAPLPPQVTDTAAADSTLGSVACTSATSCIAVGSYSVLNQNDAGALIETLDNGTWTATTAPAPADDYGNEGLSSISCASASFCVAVGSYSDSSTEIVGLIETLDNGTWTESEAPAPAGGSSASLDSVSCGAVGFCAAVNDSNAAIDTLDNGTWTATNAPLPANANNTPPPGQGVNINSVACASAGSCVAVGIYSSDQDSEQGVFEDLSNGTWTATEAPLPADADSSENARFDTVTCISAQSCLALGGYNDTTNYYDGVIDTLSDGTWTAMAAPTPINDNAAMDLSSAACAAGTCVFVGYYGGGAGGLIDTNSAGTWTTAEAPLPKNAGSQNLGELTSVSCATAGFCVAIGDYQDSTGTSEGLIETN